MDLCFALGDLTDASGGGRMGQQGRVVERAIVSFVPGHTVVRVCPHMYMFKKRARFHDMSSCPRYSDAPDIQAAVNSIPTTWASCLT